MFFKILLLILLYLFIIVVVGRVLYVIVNRIIDKRNEDFEKRDH